MWYETIVGVLGSAVGALITYKIMRHIESVHRRMDNIESRIDEMVRANMEQDTEWRDALNSVDQLIDQRMAQLEDDVYGPQ